MYLVVIVNISDVIFAVLYHVETFYGWSFLGGVLVITIHLKDMIAFFLLFPFTSQ